MLNPDFYLALEYQLSDALKHCDHEASRGFWCDGVLPSELEEHYSQQYVADSRQMIFRAFAGTDGQTVYKLIVQLGPRSQSRYARGLSLDVCFPPVDDPTWFHIDTIKQIIELWLL